MTVDLYNPHEDGDGENQDKLLDCNRDGRLGQLSQLQHVLASMECLGNELHGHVVDEEGDYSSGLAQQQNCDFVKMSIH